MKECPKCKHVLEDSCDFCPYCGQSLANVGNTEEIKDSSGYSHLKMINSEIISGTEKKEEKIPLTESEIIKTKILRIVGICMGLCIIIIPFVLNGFSIGIFWYLLIGLAIFLLMALLGCNSKMSDDKEVTNTCLIVYLIIAVIMFIFGPLNPNYS